MAALATAPERRVSPYRSLAEILENPEVLTPPEVVIPRLAWRGRVTLLAAREKDGKSTLTGAAAAAVTWGNPFLDGTALKGRVVLAGLEEHVTEIADRLIRFLADPDLVFVATHIQGNPVTDLEEAIQRIGPILVIVDTLSALSEGKLEGGSSQAWQPFMMKLTSFARHFDCAVLIIHHSRKNDGGYRDSTAIGANVDCIIEMQPDDHDPTARHLKAKCRFPVANCAIRYTDNGYELAETEASDPSQLLRNTVLRYVREHRGCSLGQLRNGVRIGSFEKRGEMATKLVAEGVLREEKGTRNARLFYPV